MKLGTILIAGAALAAVSGTAAARNNIGFSIAFGMPAPVYAAPVYYQPAPVYSPVPAYYYPPRVAYAAPRVVYAPAPFFGYRGNWREHEWHGRGRGR